MSIDWLFDLERKIDQGKDVFACPGIAQNDWVVGKPIDDLKKFAKRVADSKRTAINIVRVIAKHDALSGDQFLVPTKIEETGQRGEPQIKWSVVDTKEAAEMMRDVRHGPAPFFAIQNQDTVNPA